MKRIKPIVRKVIDSQIRDSLWALRSRGDISVLSAVMHNRLGLKQKVGDNIDHLQATIRWLCEAQDQTRVGAVAAFYDMRSGEWGPPYPETTGYIIPTFFNYAAYKDEMIYRKRAISMADWLLTLQLENGAFPIGPLWPDWERKPIVFDTGQIIHGLVRAFEEIGNSSYLSVAKRAGDWLIKIQDQDGSWKKYTSLDMAHSYNVRSAWALLRLYQICPEEEFKRAAINNIEWTISQQDKDGWFRNAEFRPNEDPLTHTIAYTIEGLLESGIYLGDGQIIQSAQMAADALIDRQQQAGFLSARFGSGWASNLRWICLTGTAQMALVWLRLCEWTGNGSYFQAAVKANQFVKETQVRNSTFKGIAGGIGGSYPIYGDYEPYRFLNWAAKFFVDSLLLEHNLSVNQVSE
jgi:uncharacterized protein YyaL (SSP411 family)